MSPLRSFQIKQLRRLRALQKKIQRAKPKLKQPDYLIGFGLSIIFFIFATYQIYSFVPKIYDNEVEEFVSQQTIILFLYFALTIIYLNIVLIARIVIQKFKKRAGSFLRFKIIGVFFLSILIPSLISTFFLYLIFNDGLKIVKNDVALDTLNSKLNNFKITIDTINQELKDDFSSKLEQGNFQLNSGGKIDYLSVYDTQGNLIFFNQRKGFKLAKRPIVSLTPIFPIDNQVEKEFASYSTEEGYSYYLYRSEENILSTSVETTIITNYYATFSFVDTNLKNSISDTINLVRQFRQLNTSFYPIAIFTLFAFLYLYVQTYSVAVIIFYNRSKAYTKPIEELVLATRQISQGKWDRINLRPFIRKMNENEIKQLLVSFSSMVKDFVDNQKRLERLSNMEAWKEVATRLAHELKNPLTPIKLATNEIENHLSKQDIATYARLQDKFHFIHTEVERIESLVKDFSLLSKNLKLKIEKIHSSVFIEPINKYFQRYPEIKFTQQSEWKGTLYLDQSKIQQVLINLIQNAIDSVLEKKRTLEEQDLNSHTTSNYQPSITLIIRKEGPRFVVEIKDNGVGIDTEKKEEIFKPYITYKTWGTGLGLPICQEIINEHQGTIHCFLHPSETCFQFSLPLEPTDSTKK